MTFEYNNVPTPQKTVDIESLCQFALEGVSSDLSYYYMIVRTSLGTSSIVTFGPIVPDVKLIPNGYTFRIKRMASNESKLSSEINRWLNDPKSNLEEVKCIDINEAIEQVRDMKQYLNDYSSEVY